MIDTICTNSRRAIGLHVQYNTIAPWIGRGGLKVGPFWRDDPNPLLHLHFRLLEGRDFGGHRLCDLTVTDFLPPHDLLPVPFLAMTATSCE